MIKGRAILALYLATASLVVAHNDWPRWRPPVLKLLDNGVTNVVNAGTYGDLGIISIESNVVTITFPTAFGMSTLWTKVGSNILPVGEIHASPWFINADMNAVLRGPLGQMGMWEVNDQGSMFPGTNTQFDVYWEQSGDNLVPKL